MLDLFRRYYYIAHTSNLASICAKGLLSYNTIKNIDILHADIADLGAQRWRDRPEPIYGRPIHDYVPLFINPRNPMLFLRRDWHAELAILKISSSVLDCCSHIYTDGNAASRDTKFSTGRDVVNEAIPVLTANFWTEHNDGKRRRCAEVLIYPNVQPMFLEGAICSNIETAQLVRQSYNLVAVVDPHMFFQG